MSSASRQVFAKVLLHSDEKNALPFLGITACRPTVSRRFGRQLVKMDSLRVADDPLGGVLNTAPLHASVPH